MPDSMMIRESVQPMNDDREREIIQTIKIRIPCTQFLTRSPKAGLNYYNCPYCGSGTGPSRTGAMEYDTDHNTVYCYKCRMESLNGKPADVLDIYQQVYNADYPTAFWSLAEMAHALRPGEQRDSKPTRKQEDHVQPAQMNRKDTETDPQDDGPTDPAADGTGTTGDPESSEPKKTNTPGLYRDDCLRWAADIEKTTYLTDMGITLDVLKSHNVGYIPRSNQLTFPFSSDFSYWMKRPADKEQKQYLKPKASEAGPQPLYNPAALYSGGPVFVCEGIIDALSFMSVGVHACAVCGSGSKALLDTVRLKTPDKPLILWMDYDLPNPNTGKCEGQEAQKSLAKDLDTAGIPYIEAHYDLSDYGREYGDPNDLFITNPEQFKLDAARNIDRANRMAEFGLDMGRFLKSVFSERYKPIKTGLVRLDDFLHGGLIPQTLVLLSGPAGTGKTIFMSQVMESMALQKHPAVYLNLEMSREQLISRSLSRMIYTDFHMQISAAKILQAYDLTAAEQDILARAARRYAGEIQPYISYNPVETSDLDIILKTLFEMGERAEKEGRQPPNVALDYLHILSSDKREDSGQILKRAVQGLKEYATRYDSIVFGIAAQSRRANESGKADIAAGRDSSSLEYSGDLILQLTVDQNDINLLHLFVNKSRFTQYDQDKSLDFIRHGGESYLEQVGEWQQLAITETTPFTDDKRAKPKPGKAVKKQ